MSQYELSYKELIQKILDEGELRHTRNGNTISVFGQNISFNIQDGFPLLTGRKIYYKGVFGELAAMLKQPKTIKDFEDQGCNYWKLWGNSDGTINIDYGNKWLDFNGINQHAELIDKLKNNPTDRRMIITGWDPSNISNLNLPCCHYAYQWYVREGKYLDMIWHQRSTDVMIGLPSDVVFASAWNIMIANEVGLIPANIYMTIGDSHIYEEHITKAEEYLNSSIHKLPNYKLNVDPGYNTIDFKSNDISIINYNNSGKITFKLKA